MLYSYIYIALVLKNHQNFETKQEAVISPGLEWKAEAEFIARRGKFWMMKLCCIFMYLDGS